MPGVRGEACGASDAGCGVTFWLDAHFDPTLAAWMGATFKVMAKSLAEVGLRDAEDEPLFDAARRFSGIVIMTKDYDFVELVLRRGAPPQVAWVNIENCSTLELQARLTQSFPDAIRLLEGGDPLVEIN